MLLDYFLFLLQQTKSRIGYGYSTSLCLPPPSLTHTALIPYTDGVHKRSPRLTVGSLNLDEDPPTSGDQVTSPHVTEWTAPVQGARNEGGGGGWQEIPGFETALTPLLFN